MGTYLAAVKNLTSVNFLPLFEDDQYALRCRYIVINILLSRQYLGPRGYIRGKRLISQKLPFYVGGGLFEGGLLEDGGLFEDLW